MVMTELRFPAAEGEKVTKKSHPLPFEEIVRGAEVQPEPVSGVSAKSPFPEAIEVIFSGPPQVEALLPQGIGLGFETWRMALAVGVVCPNRTPPKASGSGTTKKLR